MINVICSPDQGLEGIVRITGMEPMDKDVFNKIADIEYNLNDELWKDDVIKTICNACGCSSNEVSVRCV